MDMPSSVEGLGIWGGGRRLVWDGMGWDEMEIWGLGIGNWELGILRMTEGDEPYGNVPRRAVSCCSL